MKRFTKILANKGVTMVLKGKFEKSKEFTKILTKFDRSQWRSLIEPLVESVDLDNRCCYIDDTVYNFIPEELNPNYSWKFNLGDIVTNGKDIMVIVSLPKLDPRLNLDMTSGVEISKVQVYGNTYGVIQLDENGDNKDSEDHYAYLHNSFNENQLRKVDEKTSNYWKQKIKDKYLY